MGAGSGDDPQVWLRPHRDHGDHAITETTVHASLEIGPLMPIALSPRSGRGVGFFVLDGWLRPVARGGG